MPVGQQIPFGLLPDGTLVDPYSTERGLACNCVCPGCRVPLVARKGEVRIHHFGHLGDHSCRNGQAAALIQAAKQVLAQGLRLTVPSLEVVGTYRPPFSMPRRATAVLPAATWTLSQVLTGQSVGETAVDVLVVTESGISAAVMFRVTVGASPDLRDVFHRANVPALELDLRPLLGQALRMEELAEFVCESSQNRLWLHHAGQAEAETRLVARLRAAHPPHPPAPATAPPVLAARQGPPGMIPRKMSDLSMLDAERLAIRREHDRHRALSLSEKGDELREGLGADPKAWPALFRATPPGPEAIDAPATLWQGAVFQAFVLDSLHDARVRDYGFAAAAVNAWAWARFGLLPQAKMPQLIDQVYRFLGHLVHEGYLREASDKFYVRVDKLPLPMPTPGQNP